MTTTSTGPRPVTRDAHEVVAYAWRHMLATHRVVGRRCVGGKPPPRMLAPWETVVSQLTGESTGSIRSRVEAEAARVATESKEG